METLLTTRTPQHHNHHRTRKSSQETLAASYAATRFTSQTAMPQQLVGTCQQQRTRGHLTIFVHLLRLYDYLLGRGYFGEEGNFEAFCSQFCKIESRGQIATNAMRREHNRILKPQFPNKYLHPAHKSRNIDLPALMGQIETAKISLLGVLNQITPQIVRQRHRDVIRRDHEQSVQSILQSYETLFFRIETKGTSSYFVVQGQHQNFESRRYQKELLDDIVGCIESQQFRQGSHIVVQSVFVPLDDIVLLHVIN
jgi:hypothetical protein